LISDQLIGEEYVRGASGGWADAGDVFSDGGADADGAFSVGWRDTDGVFSDGFGRVSAGSCSEGVVGVAAVVLSFGPVAALVPDAVGCDGDGESRLPRMIGMLFCPAPMITTLELDDCASCKVASIPRHRR
jgi:hypothetical protein